MSTQRKARLIFAGLTLCLLWSGLPRAAEIDGDAKARKGTVRCGGSNTLRLGGTEIQYATYNLRNFNAAIPITVEQLTVYGATGQVLFDSATSGLPQFPNSTLGPLDNVLVPNQSADIATTNFLPFLPDHQRPIQLEIVWSAPEKAVLLEVVLIRIARQRDPLTGQELAERSRHTAACRTISVEK